MSDEEQSNGQLLTAEFKDGQLEIVEVASFSKDGKQHEDIAMTSSDGSEDLKYMHVLDAGKNMMVDLLNFTLVRGEDGVETYRLVSTCETDSSQSDATVTCVLSNGDEQETQEYVMVEGENGPLVLLQSSLRQTQPVEVTPSPSPPPPLPPPPPKAKKQELKKAPMTATEILERAKAYQKAKALMAAQTKRASMRPVKRPQRKVQLPSAHELLSSPLFKLYLYSCKMCRFKCNAIKELTAHKALEHGGGAARWRGGAARGGRAAAGTLQCARCPFRASAHSQLMKHVQDKHVESVMTPKVYLDSAEVEAADVLVCGACGFESGSRDVFKKHIEDEHGATTC